MQDERRYRDRRHAGRELAARLREYAGREDVVVVALPRGGVPVAYEVALALRAPLDVFLVRKLGVPGREELGFGAVGQGGVLVLNGEVVSGYGLTQDVIDAVSRRERAEIERREGLYRDARPALPLEGKTVVVVDDGLATGSTMRAAVRSLRELRAARIVVAVPVAPLSACAWMAHEADDVVCATTPSDMWAVGAWYLDFAQVDDAEARHLLAEARHLLAEARRLESENGVGSVVAETVELGAAGAAGEAAPDQVGLTADLAIPATARGVVVFAHGSGSSRLSPRNRAVAHVLQRAGLATVLLDLLTRQEEAVDLRTGQYRFDVELLAGRLLAATSRALADPRLRGLPVALFGASTGAAAALIAAARRPEGVCAVVSRGGRADLAGESLAAVGAPTLLIVGGADAPVLDLNEQARRVMRCETRLEVVPGATHLFAEPGGLDLVAELARDWVLEHLPRVGAQGEGAADAA